MEYPQKSEPSSKQILSYLKTISTDTVKPFGVAVFGGLLMFVGIAFSVQYSSAQTDKYYPVYNAQTIPLLSSGGIVKENISTAIGGTKVSVIEDALVPTHGPQGTYADVETKIFYSTPGSHIFTYEVKQGDTLGEIAEMFDIRSNTIKWANPDIGTSGTIRPGMNLTIWPIDGLGVKVKNGDTLSSLAKKYKGDSSEIALFNGLENTASLIAGEIVLIPNAEPLYVATKPKVATTVSHTAHTNTARPSISKGSYIRPTRGIKTQGFHGPYQAIDVGAPIGTPIYAMADGKVVISKKTGWNGGYGLMVVVEHPHLGSQTLYAHNSSVIVNVGEQVKQGEVIAYVGNTGRSTGPHLHFEVRGISSPVSTPLLY
ncbi:MAG: murein DD-endopeptidase MepM/ murein hydrolase activator NlpD [Flavobacteriaceae bacterium]|jgi:murein DD-endopeptidase MepM/ murein hydrolase activator NlpD